MPGTDSISPTIGLAIMAIAFAVLALAEWLLPVRDREQSQPRRWFTNLSLFALDTLLIRLVFPLAMVGGALWAAEAGWGLFNTIAAPYWLAFVATLLLLDLALYLQHWATHRVPLLWRLHRVHHSDRDFDVTTAARFHPVEIVLSMLWKMGVVIALGAPALAVFVFEVGFAVATLFTHANFALPERWDRGVRKLLVTPSMHRIHHSDREVETNSNYGTVLTLWDRLFGTYVASGREGQRGMTIGLKEWEGDQTSRLGFSLWLPFTRR
ncbi:sterol desaturase family protein [Erythrobacter sp. JGD-13]|uniref:Sterol desaturase family protein n=2 Tax=Aurantiacibacter sediminis TaxID=2793064 RepID=A0ABS0N1F7_9SPHN|nr:sterol desaturase family protein [Aurantiacibacter sediminis]